MLPIAVDEKHGTLVTRNMVEDIEAKQSLEIDPPKPHAPQVVGVGDVVCRTKPFNGIVGDAKGGIHQHHASEVIGSATEIHHQGLAVFVNLRIVFVASQKKNLPTG